MSVDSDRYAKSTSQSKVSDLYHTFVVNQQILGFEVTMHHSPLMTEQHTLGYLEHVTLQQTKATHLDMLLIKLSKQWILLFVFLSPLIFSPSHEMTKGIFKADKLLLKWKLF